MTRADCGNCGGSDTVHFSISFIHNEGGGMYAEITHARCEACKRETEYGV